MQFSASQNLIATAGGSADIGVLRRFTVAAGDAISMFAQRMGMKLFAKGKVEVQSQSDEMALSALKDITITSSDGRLILSAAKEVWIGAAGSYIKINANRIENGTPGDILEKCSAWSKQGATSTQQQRQKFFDSQTELSFSQQFHVDDALLNLSEKTGPVKYRILDETGVLIGGGVLAESGRTLRAFTETSQPIKAVLDLYEGKWSTASYKEPFEFSSDSLEGRHLGLFDYADHRTPNDQHDIVQREEGHEAVEAFLDQFNHRIVTLLYRAWKKYRYPETFRHGGADARPRAVRLR
jgi:type VI secretion system secreted protein VgrG